MKKMPISSTYSVSSSMPQTLSPVQKYNRSNRHQQQQFIYQSNSNPRSRSNSNSNSKNNIKDKGKSRLQSSIIKNKSIIEQSSLSFSKASSPSRIKLSLKQSQPQQSEENKQIYRQIHESILIQSKIRQLKKKIQLQQQILKNKKIYDQVQRQLRQQEEQIKQKKRQIIKNRLAQIQANKKKRTQMEEESYKKLMEIREKQRQRRIILKKITETDKKQYQQCYQNTLKERRKLLKPINFDAIKIHEKKYIKNRVFKTQGEQQNEQQQKSKQKQKQKSSPNPKQSLYHSKSQISNSQKKQTKNMRYMHSQRIMEQQQEDQSMNNSSQYNQKVRINKSKSKHRNKKKIKSAIDSYLQQRHKQQQKIEKLKEVIQRSKEYGDRVQRQYSHNRTKTQEIEAQKKEKERLDAQEKARMINERNLLLKNMKKPQLPKQININAQIGKNYELRKVIQSNEPAEEKMLKLNQIAEAQISRLRNKGKSWDLQRLNKINMMRAELLLNYQ